MATMRRVRLGELREMTADLSDDTEVVLMVPAEGEDWRESGCDIGVSGPSWGNVSGWSPAVVVIEGSG